MLWAIMCTEVVNICTEVVNYELMCTELVVLGILLIW